MRHLWILTLAASLVPATGCSAIRFGGDPTPDIAGTWSGAVNVEGSTLDGTLALTQTGQALDAVFRAPSFGLDSRGTGRVDEDGAIALELGYDMECPGVARLTGTTSEDATRLSGTLEASDCTGTVRGTFSFTRR